MNFCLSNYAEGSSTIYFRVNPIYLKNLQHEVFLAKQNGQRYGKISAPGSVFIKTTLVKSLAEAFLCTQTVFLSKQVLTIVAGRRRDAQMIEVPGAFTLLRWFSTTNKHPLGQKASRMASAFLGKHASITAVDLIQRKKLEFLSLNQRKPDLKLFNSLPFY